MMKGKRILIVIDMQNDFVTGPLGTPEAQAIVPAVVRLINDKDYDYIYATKDTHGVDYLGTHEGKHLPVEHCIENTEGWRLQPDIADALEDVWDLNDGYLEVVRKNTFGSADLVARIENFAKWHAIEHIDICGLCTDICVVSNALMLRSAFPETDIRVMADACAGTTPENQDAAFRVMRMCHIDIVGGVMPAGE